MPLLHAFLGCLGKDRNPAPPSLLQSHNSTLDDNGTCISWYGGRKLADVLNKDASSQQPSADTILAQYNSQPFQSKDRDLQRSLTLISATSSFAISTGVSPDSASSSDLTTRLSDASTDSSAIETPAATAPAPRSQAQAKGRLIWSKLQQTLKNQQQLKQFAPDQLLGVHVLVDGSATSTPSEVSSTASAVDADTLQSYVLQHGRGIMACSTLQEGMQHFVVPGIGYIAYSMMYNGPPFLNIKSAVVLGDPVCAPEHYSSIAAAFLHQHPKAAFVQISRDFGEVLQNLGLLVNSLGGETELDLQKYTFSGYAKRGLRSAISSAVKEGVTVEEVMRTHLSPASSTGAAAEPAGFQDWSQLGAEMQQVDQEWVKAKGKHAGRIWFLNRSPVFAPEPCVRKLVARSRDGRLQAFIFFDAVFEGGSIIGYYANVTRMRPDAHPGVLNVLIKEFIETIRSEAQLTAPRKNLSIKRSQRQKQQRQQQQQLDTVKTPDTAANPVGVLVPADKSGGITAPRFLSLGLSLLHQMDDSHFKHNSKMRYYLELARKHGSAFYPFKSLAAAKAKYGAGLHDGRYEDPNVVYKQVYLAHSQNGSAVASFVSLFDLGVMIGVWKGPHEATAGLLAYNIKRRARRLVGKRPSRRQQ